MKKLIVTLFVSLSSCICLYSQNDTPEFGKVTYYDFMRTYDLKDKNATACVVYESGRYSFATDIAHSSTKTVLGSTTGISKAPPAEQQSDPARASISSEGSGMSDNYYERFHRDVYVRIHILKQEGVEHATLEIPYYSSLDDVDVLTIEGYTYNPDDSYNIIQTPLDISAIIDEKVANNLYVKKITMPEAREGSIVELRYSQSSIYYDMPVWDFQKTIPVVYSELQYDESAFRRYAMILKGAPKFDVYKEEEKSINTSGAAYSSVQTLHSYTYGMRDLEAFEEVDFLRNPVDYRIAVHPRLSAVAGSGNRSVIEYLVSWPLLRKELLSNAGFGRYVKSSAKEAKKIIAGLDLQDHDDAGKIEAIVKYVKNNYIWDGDYGISASKKLSAFLMEKRGNTGNLNLFLAGMLQAAGIESYPVVVSTKPNGIINKAYPFEALFDFVVIQAVAGGNTYYLDAANTYAPFDMVSMDCIDTEGLVLKPKAEEWAMITNHYPSVSNAEMTLTINPESGIVSGDVVESYSGLDAVKYRQLYGGDQENLETIISKDLGNFTLAEASTENFGDTELPFLIKYSFESRQEDTEDPQDGQLSINPLEHLAPKDNIFTETRRQYPIDMVAKSSDSYIVSISIPEGYTVEYLPEPQRIDNREISMVYSAVQNGDTIIGTAQFAFKNAVYPGPDYNLLKKYYGDMITAFSRKIILKKEE